MARRKNTAEAFEVLYRIARKQAEARASAQGEAASAPASPAAGGRRVGGAPAAPRDLSRGHAGLPDLRRSPASSGRRLLDGRRWSADALGAKRRGEPAALPPSHAEAARHQHLRHPGTRAMGRPGEDLSRRPAAARRLGARRIEHPAGWVDGFPGAESPAGAPRRFGFRRLEPSEGGAVPAAARRLGLALPFEEPAGEAPALESIAMGRSPSSPLRQSLSLEAGRAELAGGSDESCLGSPLGAQAIELLEAREPPPARARPLPEIFADSICLPGAGGEDGGQGGGWGENPSPGGEEAAGGSLAETEGASGAGGTAPGSAFLSAGGGGGIPAPLPPALEEAAEAGWNGIRGPRASSGLGLPALRTAAAVVRFPVRALRWFLGSEADQVLGRQVEMRISTLILYALALVIVLSLIGIYLKTPPREDKLYRNFAARGSFVENTFDDFDSLPAAALSEPLAAAPYGSAPAMALPVHRAPPVASPLPEFRNLESRREPEPRPPPLEPKPWWVRVRAKMFRTECLELCEHLATLRSVVEMEVDPARAGSSLAYKRIESAEMAELRDGEPLYIVYIGPFERIDEAKKAAEELKRLGRRLPFKGRAGNYFDDAYACTGR
jgi:hypothetical protein